MRMLSASLLGSKKWPSGAKRGESWLGVQRGCGSAVVSNGGLDQADQPGM